ncbi:MAG: DUF4363 family protein [Clostridia bacterium]|jgi:hypothetical protein|nr:DUF4363 family protein [Clostridia bacterium]
MKHIIVAVMIVIIILSLGITEQIIIKNTFDEVYKYAEDIRALLVQGDNEEALLKTVALSDYWKKKSDLMEFMFPHNEFRDFIMAVSELKGNIVTEEYENAIALTYVIAEDAVNRQDLLLFKLKNVL